MLAPKIHVKDKNKVYDIQVIDYKHKLVIFFDNETQCTYTRLFDEVDFMENTGLKDKIQFKKLTEKYPKKIEEIKNINMQLKAIYDSDENEFTQEIIELAEDLIIKK